MRILALIAIAFLLACSGADTPGATEISREEFVQSRPGSFLILDVRTPAEFAAGHIKSAMNIPHDVLPEQLGRIQQYAGVPVVVYCKSGRRAGMAAEVLVAAGFTNLRHLTGDMDGWIEAGYPVTQDLR